MRRISSIRVLVVGALFVVRSMGCAAASEGIESYREVDVVTPEAVASVSEAREWLALHGEAEGEWTLFSCRPKTHDPIGLAVGMGETVATPSEDRLERFCSAPGHLVAQVELESETQRQHCARVTDVPNHFEGFLCDVSSFDMTPN